MTITTDGRGIEGRAGTALLSLAADEFGLTGALRTALDGVRSWESHPPGAVVRDLAVMLADGGTATDHIQTLRRRDSGLFGTVASQPTAWRTIEAIAADELASVGVFDHLAEVRQRLWDAGAAPPDWEDPDVPALVDIDATLVTAHSDKPGAAGNYKGGFGYHPLVAFVDRGDGRGEPIGMLLRPGNAGANTVVDNGDLVEQALWWLPARPDGKQVVIRGDSAMATKGLTSWARQAGAKVSVSLPIGNHPSVRAAIRTLHSDQPEAWKPALTQDGKLRDRAHVAELAEVPLGEGWPDELRIIVRREPLHPGAQQTIDDIDGHRFTAQLTDLAAPDIVALDVLHRGRARVEDRIKDAKDTGLANLPFDDFERNDTWMMLVLLALQLVCWTQTLLLDGDLALARPPTLRYQLWHTAARIVRSGRKIIVRLQADWPWAHQLAEAFQRLRTLQTAPVPAD